jgi:predicted nuclease of predicted toxin-antitoxin system
MKYLVDAQLPLLLARFINRLGYEAIHTSELPEGNRTSDNVIQLFSDNKDMIVVTKDFDFVTGHLLHNKPKQILLISTGNIANKELLGIIEKNLDLISQSFCCSNFLELTRTGLVIH